jgi:hypothetical protein
LPCSFSIKQPALCLSARAALTLQLEPESLYVIITLSAHTLQLLKCLLSAALCFLPRSALTLQLLLQSFLFLLLCSALTLQLLLQGVPFFNKLNK